MLLVCCFCDKVRDDTRNQATQGFWQDLQVSMASRNLRREDIIFSYTCCRDCLQGDPRAITFRARRSQSSAPVFSNGWTTSTIDSRA